MGESKRNILDNTTGFGVRINFYIIRYLYRHVKLHDSFRDIETNRAINFYTEIINISRQRFARLQNGENFELKKEEMDYITKKFNIDGEYSQKNAKIIEIYSLDEDDWKCYFKEKLQCSDIKVHYSSPERQRRSNKVEEQLKKLVKKDYIVKNYTSDTCIYRLYYYFQYGVPFFEKSRLTNFIEALEKLKISDWKELDNDPERFQYCCDLIRKQYEYTWAFAKCRELEKE